MLAADGLLSFPFPAIETGFTMWDFPPLILDHHQVEEAFSTCKEPVVSMSSELENKTTNRTRRNSGPYEPVIDDERRVRRMISNRESARRSRVRKQKHMENLREEMNRLITGKRELANRLEFVLEQNRIKKRENDGLRCESEKLRQKLWAMRQILILKHLSHSNIN